MKTIIKFTGLIALFIAIISSCNATKKEEKNVADTIVTTLQITDSIGEKLFNQKCMICHTHVGRTDSTMIAPPFFQVKDRYLRASIDKADFIETMTHWVKNPKEENILMRGTIGRFEVMPYLAYQDEEIAKIVNYIYENDIPKPEWFDAHQAEHRKKRRGKGQGRGPRSGQGKRRGLR